MIIVKLQGGLGNQMFQYAFGKAISNRLNQSLYFDDTLLTEKPQNESSYILREFELSNFPGIELKLLPGFLKNLVYSKSQFIHKLINKLQLTIFNHQAENEYLDLHKFPLRPINIFEGYFQSQNYFYDFSDTIRSGFRFPEMDDRNNLLTDQIKNSNSVAIHIRRGDYFSNTKTFQYHGILPLRYYKDSIEILRKTQSDLTFFIFTDDVLWVKENFKPEYPEAIIAEGNSGTQSWKDMALMTYAKHHIISNSSFSWWGAWLAGNQGMKIAPGRWFNPEVANFDIQTIIPGNWTIVY